MHNDNVQKPTNFQSNLPGRLGGRLGRTTVDRHHIDNIRCYFLHDQSNC